jgi:hypothetical protein
MQRDQLFVVVVSRSGNAGERQVLLLESGFFDHASDGISRGRTWGAPFWVSRGMPYA